MHALQSFEAFRRNFAGAGDELNHLGQMLLVVSLQDLPEPSDDVVSYYVPGVLDIVLEIVH